MTTPFSIDDGALVCRFGGETLRVEPWRPDAARVRACPGLSVSSPHVDALLPGPDGCVWSSGSSTAMEPM